MNLSDSDNSIKSFKKSPIKVGGLLIILIILVLCGFYFAGFFGEMGRKHAEQLPDQTELQHDQDSQNEKAAWLNRVFKIDKNNGGTIETCDGSNCIKLIVEPITELAKEPEMTINLVSATIPSFSQFGGVRLTGIVPIEGAYGRISFEEFEIRAIVEKVNYQSVEFRIEFSESTFERIIKPDGWVTMYEVEVSNPRYPKNEDN